MSSSASVLKDVMNPDIPQFPGGDASPQQVTSAGQDPTGDDPNKGTPEQNQQAIQLTDQEKEELLALRREYKLTWAPNRRTIVKKVLRAFEQLKGNSYVAFDADGFQWYDPISAALNGTSSDDAADLYKFNTNIYQMLALSYMAALSPQVPKARYQPEDASNEPDLATARRASTIMSIIERKNNIKSLQKLELLHHWTGGVYFSYCRYLIDADRAGTTKQPIIDMVPQQTPDMFQCPKCGTATPAQAIGAWQKPACPKCGTALGEEDYYPGESISVPQEVGKEDVPNGMTRIDVFGAANIDAAPYAQDLHETPLLDLEVETDVAGVRAAYPEAWDQLNTSMGSAGNSEGEAERLARIQMTSASGVRSGYLSDSLITYSRCWFQSWAFNRIQNKAIADSLKKKFPNGCKLVSAGATQFLEAVAEKMSDVWTWCPTIRGMGLYPFAVGESALDVQERIDDAANITHEYVDRLSVPSILIDADALDEEKMNGLVMSPGRITPVKRKGLNGGATPLSNIIFQPQLHIDASIYSYSQSLIQLAQLVSGVLPQIFGGSDKNVQTASGQEQMLNTALGRLSLFWDQIREEHAQRAENAVKCFANNMGEKVVHVIEGDSDSGFENEYVLLTEMQGTFHAYPESDQGFPVTWAEQRDRIMQLMEQVDNPFVAEFLEDPDNQKTVARYLIPDEIKIPGDSARTKYKRIIGALAKAAPFEVQPEEAAQLGIMTPVPIFLPQTQDGLAIPDPDFDQDTLAMIKRECLDWGMNNWKQAETNPEGYENVRAYLRIAVQKLAEAQMKQAMMAAPPPQGPPPGKGAPSQPVGAGA